LLETSSPVGIERFFEAAGHPLTHRQDRPLPNAPSDIAHMQAIAPSFGIDILSSPYAKIGQQ